MSVYYKHRWFNIIGIIRSEGIHYYCNIASPCIVEDDVIKYIDYDLDLVKTIKGELKVLDEDDLLRIDFIPEKDGGEGNAIDSLEK